MRNRPLKGEETAAKPLSVSKSVSIVHQSKEEGKNQLSAFNCISEGGEMELDLCLSPSICASVVLSHNQVHNDLVGHHCSSITFEEKFCLTIT